MNSNAKRRERDAVRLVSCPRCDIIEGERCLDMRTPEGPTRYLKHVHLERLESLYARTLVILVGASGSGKSSWGRTQSSLSSVVCSADNGMMVDGVYCFDPSKLGEAHRVCAQSARNAMKGGASKVVIDNTNTTLDEIRRYLSMGQELEYKIEVLVFPEKDPEILAGRNKHGVPIGSILGQLARIKATLDAWPPDWPKYRVVKKAPT